MRNLRVAAAFVVTSVLFYWKVIFTHQFSFLTGYEGVNQAYSWYQFILSALRAGKLPAWDPFTFAGHSFIGEMQTGAFYPGSLLLALIPLNQNHLFSPAAYHVYVVLTHALAGYLMFRLIRLLGLGRFAGFVAGITFSFSGLVAKTQAWPHMFESAVWLPAIFELALRAWREHRASRALLLASTSGILFGMAILAGGLQVAIMDGLVMLSAASYMWAISESGSRRTNVVATGLVLFAVAFAASSIQLLPSIEYSHRAYRFLGSMGMPGAQKIPYAYLEDDHLWPFGFIGLLFPTGFAGNIGSGEVLEFYVGVFPLLLATVGLWMNRTNRWCRYFAGLAVAGFLYSMGSVSLVHGLGYALIPDLWLAREASRFMYLADFALVVLAGFGAETLFARVDSSFWRQPTRMLNYVAAAAALALFIPALSNHLDIGAWTGMSLLLILLSWALYCLIARGHRGTGAKFLAIALILFDLSAFDWSAQNKIDLAREKHVDEMDRLLSLRAASEFLKSRPGPFRVYPDLDFAPNFGDAYGVESTGGAGVTLLEHFDQIRGHIELLNARYILRPASAPQPDPLWHDSNWKVYENPKAFPRAWIVHDVAVEPMRAALLRSLNNPALDLGRKAFVGAPLKVTVQSDPAQAATERVDLDRYDVWAPEVTVHTHDRALLVLSEIDYPGWKASVNGRSEPIIEVDGALRGIVVPAGDSRVSLRYRAATLFWGAGISLVTLISVGLCWLLAIRGDRRALTAQEKKNAAEAHATVESG